MENCIVAVILVCVISAAVLYLYKAKKKGQVCVGCPYSKQCASKKTGDHSKHCNCGNSDLNEAKE